MGMLDDFQDPQVAGKRSALDSFDSSSPDPTQHGHGQDRPAQAALEGFGETASMGYLPHLQAAAETATATAGNSYDKLKAYLGGDISKTDEGLRQQGFKVPEQSYVKSRDENIARQAGLEESNPYSSVAGKVGGMITTAALPVGQAAKGAGLAAKIGRGAATGAIQGAAYNPGDTAGEISPVQAGPRAENAAIGAAVGGTLASAGHGLGELADKSRMVSRVKDSAGLSSSVKGEIDEALNNVKQNYVKPRAEQVKELVQGQPVSLNPDRLKGISQGLDQLADKFIGRADDAGRVELQGQRALRLRKLLDARANYSASQPFEAGSAAKGESAKAAADILRRGLSDIDPKVGELNSEMGNAIRLSKSLAKRAKSAPISAIKAAEGTDKASIVDAVDQLAGSNLERTGQRIGDAQKLLIKGAGEFVSPLQIPNTIRKLAVRGAAGAALPIDATIKKLPVGTKNAILQGLLEKKR